MYIKFIKLDKEIYKGYYTTTITVIFLEQALPIQLRPAELQYISDKVLVTVPEVVELMWLPK